MYESREPLTRHFALILNHRVTREFARFWNCSHRGRDSRKLSKKHIEIEFPDITLEGIIWKSVL
jgi:hypothetical protein